MQQKDDNMLYFDKMKKIIVKITMTVISEWSLFLMMS